MKVVMITIIVKCLLFLPESLQFHTGSRVSTIHRFGLTCVLGTENQIVVEGTS